MLKYCDCPTLNTGEIEQLSREYSKKLQNCGFTFITKETVEFLDSELAIHLINKLSYQEYLLKTILYKLLNKAKIKLVQEILQTTKKALLNLQKYIQNPQNQKNYIYKPKSILSIIKTLIENECETIEIIAVNLETLTDISQRHLLLQMIIERTKVIKILKDMCNAETRPQSAMFSVFRLFK